MLWSFLLFQSFFLAVALASMCKLAILSCVLCSNSYLSLAFVSPKVSFTFLTIGDKQGKGWVGLRMSPKGKQEG
jgi:hypothetical protein